MDMFIDLTAEDSSDESDEDTRACEDSNDDGEFVSSQATSTTSVSTSGFGAAGSSSNYSYASIMAYQSTSNLKKAEHIEQLNSSSSSAADFETLAHPAENSWRQEDYFDTEDYFESNNQPVAVDEDSDDEYVWPPKKSEPQNESENSLDYETEDVYHGSQESLRSFHPLSDSEPSDKDDFENDLLKITPIKKKQTVRKQKSPKPKTTNNQVAATNKGRKRKTPEEREAEELEKQDKRRKAEEKKRMQPKNCQNYISLEMDSAITEIPALSAVLLSPPISQIQSKVCDRPVPFSVCWKRELLPGPLGEKREEQCNMMIQVLGMEMVKNLVLLDDLSNHARELISSQSSTTRVSFIIYGSQQYFKALQKSKKKNPNEITRDQLDEAIACCEFDHNASFKLVESPQEVGEWLYRYSKALAEQPHKALTKGSWQEKFRFHLASEKNGNIRTGTATALGLSHLWLQTVKKFKRVPPEACEAIVHTYPTPTAIIKAYENCDSIAEAKKLLQNIVFQKGSGPLAVQRRIGPILSHKFHTLFTSTDPNMLLTN